MSALVLTGCFQAQQEDQQPEPVSQIENGSDADVDESAANDLSTFQHDGYGFQVVIPASWGDANIAPNLGDTFIIGSKKDNSKEIIISTIETASKEQLSGDDIEEVWLGENSKWAFYYEKGMNSSAEAQELLKSFKAIEPANYVTVKEKIENMDSIGFDMPAVVISNCSKEAEGLNKSLEGTIKSVGLGEYGSTKYLNILKSANPDKLTKEQLEAIADPCSELATNQVLKVTDEYILWGYPKCSGGAIPAEGEPGYQDYQDCLKIEKELNDYLGLSD